MRIQTLRTTMERWDTQLGTMCFCFQPQPNVAAVPTLLALAAAFLTLCKTKYHDLMPAHSVKYTFCSQNGKTFVASTHIIRMELSKNLGRSGPTSRGDIARRGHDFEAVGTDPREFCRHGGTALLFEGRGRVQNTPRALYAHCIMHACLA